MLVRQTAPARLLTECPNDKYFTFRVADKQNQALNHFRCSNICSRRRSTEPFGLVLGSVGAEEEERIRQSVPLRSASACPLY